MSILLLLLYLAILILPGCAVYQVIRPRLNAFIFSVSVSYTLFTLLFIFANHFSISAIIFMYVVACYVVISAGYIISTVIAQRKIEITKSGGSLLLSIGVISLISAIYQVIFGSFVEVPADIYSHIERYQTAVKTLADNSLGKALPWKDLFFQKSGVFYYLLACARWLTNSSADTVIPVIDFANRTLFLCTTYFFARTVFKQQKNVVAISTLTVLFVALHMGINVFSYVRYYSLAPGMLNMIIYMSAVGIFLSVSSQNFSLKSIGAYFLILLLILTASAVHVQEAMYIGIIIALIAAFGSVSKLKFVPFKLAIDKRQSFVITTLGLAGFISIYLYSHYNLTRAPNAHWRLWEFGPGFWFIPDITILNLKLQFSKVMTLWGLFVYGLFLFNIKRYTKNPFILAAMLSPLATILNPFFVDLFLRHYSSTTLWRLCFLIPIHFVAADLFVHYAMRFKNNHLLSKTLSALVIILLLGLLLPIKNTWQGVHYSRFPTLMASDKTLGYSHYQDLTMYLASLELSYNVLTDPVTGYMISAMTRHENSRQKFFRGYPFKHFTFQDYSNSPLKQYKNYLLIVNKRPRTLSVVGKLSQHWDTDTWTNTKHYYPPQLLKRLNSNPNLFELLWSENEVQVYKVL